MEIYLIVNGKDSESIKRRLEFEEVTGFYHLTKVSEVKDLLENKGYSVYKNGLFKIEKPNDEKIAIYTGKDSVIGIFAFLFNLPEDVICKQFIFTEESITKFWIQNYAEGYSAPRLIVFNDNTHNYKEV